MKKYVLFDEHKRQELYGDTPEDALLSIPSIPRSDRYIPAEKSGKMYGDKPICVYAPREDIMIKKIIGIEDTSMLRRGDKQCIRIICDTSIGRISIDMYDITTPITILDKSK